MHGGSLLPTSIWIIDWIKIIFEMKIKSKFTFQIDIRNKIDLYFYLHFCFTFAVLVDYSFLCSGWI